MSNHSIVEQLTEGQPISDAAACLAPLLDALTWRGTPRQIAEALTARWESAEIRDIRNTMANLNFRSWAQEQRINNVDQRLLPCIFETNSGDSLVLWESREGNVVAYDSSNRDMSHKLRGRRKGTAYFFVPEDDSEGAGRKWFRPVIRRFEPYMFHLILMSFIVSLLGLATPLFVKSVFDQVIGAKSVDTLVFLVIGVGMALMCEAIIRLLRSSLLSYIGGRLDVIVNNGVVGKLIDLPLNRLEKASVGTQLSRLREFEGIRGFFAGPMAVSLLELPFVIIYVIAIAMIGGWLAAVPLVLMLIMGGGAYLSLKYSKAAVSDALAGNSDCQSLLIEIFNNLRFIKDEGTEDIWLERFRERSTQLALSNLQGARINARFQTFAQSVMVIAGATTLALGAGMAIEGAFSPGTLIACMALVWRVLSPLQTLFLTFTKLQEVKNGITRIDQLMLIPSETQIATSGETVARDQEFEGKVSFSRVVLRYSSATDPALGGVSFDINPGEVVAIIGANGSGKSTILKLIADLYKPQAGSVSIDDIDTRQINLLDLRQALAYLPQKADLFAGTIAENLKVANPVATRAEVEDACYRAGILDDVYLLPQGLDTVLTEQTVKQVSTGFKKGIAVARTLLSKSNIMLLDEPSVGLDVESDEMLRNEIESCRGRKTTLLVTHRPDYVQLADRVLALRAGKIVFDGSPADLASMGRQ
jgi:ATP-binding cassette, subfamily C, bacterial LapB